MEEPANTILSALMIGNYVILAAWIVLVIIALVRLRRVQISSTAAALWVIVITMIPVIGALGFLLAHPDSSASEQTGARPQ
jgi:hypothetical protein